MSTNEIFDSIKKSTKSAYDKIDKQAVLYLDEMVTPKLVTFFYWILLFAFITKGIGDMFEGDFFRGLVWVVGEVLESKSERFKAGDIVEGRLGWQQYAVAQPKDLRIVYPELAPITTALGILGMPGQTAYFGLLEVGRPRSGETVVVSAASGAVGGVVGQIARLKGCRAIGIVGSAAKREYALSELGYEAVIDRTIDDVGAELSATCPDGVDVYFDNVGGHILDVVLEHINLHARIAICGMISEYNLPTPELAVRPTRTLLTRRARMQGLLVSDYADRADEALQQLGGWVRSGALKYREDIIEGLEHAPAALIRVLRGENFGKQLVRVGADPT